MEAVNATGKYRLIPGRLRIEVNGLYRNSALAKQLTEQLHNNVKGIHEVTVNPLTGRILVFFNDQDITFSQIKSEINSSVAEFRRRMDLYAKELLANQPAATMAAVPIVQAKSSPWLYTLTLARRKMAHQLKMRTGQDPTVLFGTVVLGMLLLPSVREKLRPLAVKTVEGIMGLSEQAQGVFSGVREDLEDIVSEAKFENFKSSIDNAIGETEPDPNGPVIE